MTYKGIIAKVIEGGLSERAGLAAGDKILSVNGENIRDLIDFSFATAERNLKLLIEKKSGEQKFVSIKKNYDANLGIEFESAVFDKTIQCANKCVFCFVDQLPTGRNLRKSLCVKDDDYRLSFLYGNFITLTNLRAEDLERIKKFHLSPLYISVHTTNGELRAKMLNNPKAALIMEQLRALKEAGISFHTQVVLCPGLNDSNELHKTVKDLTAFYPAALSLAVVPVGLTNFRENCYPLTPFSKEAAEKIIAESLRWREERRRKYGYSFVYLADELYLKAGIEIPPFEYYDDFPQLENGVGIVRSFLDEWHDCEIGVYIPKSDIRPRYVDVVCATSAKKILQSLLAELKLPNKIIRLVAVKNKFFGENITVTGLLTGKDVLAALKELKGERDYVILPGVSLKKGEEIFLDGLTPKDIAANIRAKVEIAHSAGDLKRLLAI